MCDSRVRLHALAVLPLALFVAAPAWCHDPDAEPEPAPEEEAPDEDVAPSDPEPPVWKGRVALGGSLRGGDESRYSGNADGMIERSWGRSSLVLRALADYGQSGGERDTENYAGSLAWRHGWNSRFFWLSTVGADSDQVQGRNLRLTVDSGPGYRVWEAGDDRFFDVQSGLGYRHEEFRGDEPANDLVDLRAGYAYEDVIGEVLEIVHRTDAFAPVNDFEAFLAKSEITLSVPFLGGLRFRNHARYEYVNEPVEDRESSNFWLTIGLEYRL